MFGKIHQGSHLALEFYVLGVFWLPIQSPYLLLFCSDFQYVHDSVFVGCMIPVIYPFLVGYPVCLCNCSCCCCSVTSVMSDSVRPHRRQPTRLLHPWDFPGKSTGVGCHCQIPLSDRGSSLFLVCSMFLSRRTVGFWQMLFLLQLRWSRGFA